MRTPTLALALLLLPGCGALDSVLDPGSKGAAIFGLVISTYEIEVLTDEDLSAERRAALLLPARALQDAVDAARKAREEGVDPDISAVSSALNALEGVFLEHRSDRGDSPEQAKARFRQIVAGVEILFGPLPG